MRVSSVRIVLNLHSLIFNWGFLRDCILMSLSFHQLVTRVEADAMPNATEWCGTGNSGRANSGEIGGGGSLGIFQQTPGRPSLGDLRPAHTGRGC